MLSTQINLYPNLLKNIHLNLEDSHASCYLDLIMVPFHLSLLPVLGERVFSYCLDYREGVEECFTLEGEGHMPPSM